jgi:BioD-like phosphotransacetylase family protein
MKSLYITSVEPHSGKTAVCLALGRQLQADGYKVGFLKPLSTQPWRTPDGKLVDEDAAFVQSALALQADPAALSPVVVTPTSLRERLQGKGQDDLLLKIKRAAQEAGKGNDILLLEGGASLREGYAMGLSNLQVAEALGAPALVLVRYRGDMNLVDDALTARFRLQDRLLGLILNHIPEEAKTFVEEYAKPYLLGQGIRCLGCLPRVPRLSALSLGEIIELLEAEVLTQRHDPQALVEVFTVGAMTADAALSRFRRHPHKAVITGGDRTDIMLAALETSTVALILTGNLRPSPLIVQQAEALQVPMLLVKGSTMETVEAIEHAYGRTSLGGKEKLETFTQLMAKNVDVKGIYSALGLNGRR